MKQWLPEKLISATRLRMLKLKNKPQWRFISTPFTDGAKNMAIDESLLHNLSENDSPIIRFYGWNPACISLGRYQSVEQALHLDKCREAGVECVRRMTGGGIIYHFEELTYSIICHPKHIASTGKVKDDFKKLTSFLHQFYANLGISASYAIDVAQKNDEVKKIGEKTQLCFAGHEPYDILIAGKKLGGNAQRRMRNVIFQHGSIPLFDQLNNVKSLLKNPVEVESSNTTTLSALLQKIPEILSLQRLLLESFVAAFNVEIDETGLNEKEIQKMAHLMEEKYSQIEWNHTGKVS
jgi:lipoate-protein ligase A